MRPLRAIVVSALAVGLLAACSTDPATEVKQRSAVLNATVQAPAGVGRAEYFFRVRRLDDGAAVPDTTTRFLPGGTGPTQVSERIGDLEPYTEYEYRLCGGFSSGSGAARCLAPRRFTTLGYSLRTVTFDEPGAHTLTVPEGVTSIDTRITGGAGGTWPLPYFSSSPPAVPPGASPGGRGAEVRASLAVTPGQTLVVRVGGVGANALPPVAGIFPGTGARGGTNGRDRGGDGGTGTIDGTYPFFFGLGGAGAGGGAPTTVETPGGERLLVAGAGGGAGTGTWTGPDATTRRSGGDGGLVGTGSPTTADAPAAAGGTRTAGGAGGAKGGRDGTKGDGGDGGTDTIAPTDIPCLYRYTQGGGGGGGGWFGGGGGGAGRVEIDYSIDCGPPYGGGSPYGTFTPLAGGGGGSSYASPAATGTSAWFKTGVEEDGGVARFAWYDPSVPND